MKGYGFSVLLFSSVVLNVVEPSSIVFAHVYAPPKNNPRLKRFVKSTTMPLYDEKSFQKVAGIRPQFGLIRCGEPAGKARFPSGATRRYCGGTRSISSTPRGM